jgi:SAM-dependent methyltransferase
MIWTKERIQEFIDQEQLKYQHIDLPYGLRIEGDKRSIAIDAIFSEPVSEKSFLDVGSYLGKFCFEACKRGAKEVVGWEVEQDRVRQARILAEILGYPARFECHDIEEEQPVRTFDIVLCLNVLHHMRNPLQVLDRLIYTADETLILEVASLTSPNMRRCLQRLGIGAILAIWPWSRLPLIFVGQSGIVTRDQKFFISSRALVNILRHRGTLFSSLKVVKSGFKNRYLLIAKKRRIDELVVVAGPTASGKSMLIDQLMNGALPELVGRLGIERPAEWVTASADTIYRLDESRSSKIIFHYDLLGPWGRSCKTHSRDTDLALLGRARKVAFVTLWTPTGTLIERMTKKINHHKLWRRTGTVLRGQEDPKARDIKVQHIYQQKDMLLSWYQRWIDFVALKYGDKPHLIIEMPERRVYEAKSWLSRIMAGPR